MPPRWVDRLAEEHGCLARQLEACLTRDGKVDLEQFDRFRHRLLRLVAIEERLLLPALEQALGSAPAFHKALRKDHTAMVQLCVPSPVAEWVANLRELLTWHFGVEEAPGGFYALVERHLGSDEALGRAALALPALELPPFAGGAGVNASIRQVMREIGVSFEGVRPSRLPG
jgi:hypothetical protein